MFEINLLFNADSEKDFHELNRLAGRDELQMTEKQFREMIERRGETLKANHLLDLSINSQNFLASELGKSTLVDGKNYFQYLLDLQDLFYFVRSNVSFHMADEELLEHIMLVFEKYAGSISHIEGYFEEWLIHENLKEAGENESVDEPF